MSTRATIQIKERNYAPIYIYHHHDGFPDGIGRQLKSFLTKQNNRFGIPRWDAEEIATQIIQGAIINKTVSGDEVSDMDYRVTNCIHMDSEYLYVIDCDEHTIKCHEKDYDSMDVDMSRGWIGFSDEIEIP